MFSKLATLFWFAQRPGFWPHAVALAVRKFKPNLDSPEQVQLATSWAKERAVPVEEALRVVGLDASEGAPSLSPELMDEAQARADASPVVMGGPGDLDLLHAVTVLSGATHILETGVAYGWSSLSILAGIQDRAEAKLVSVDMPYPKAGGEAYVGIVVPDRLRDKWRLVRLPDRPGVVKALEHLGNRLDVCHYDSDKSWWGRQYAFPILWGALKPGGIMISDDIQDNMAFARFVEQQQCDFAVTESDGKFVGIIRKP